MYIIFSWSQQTLLQPEVCFIYSPLHSVSNIEFGVFAKELSGGLLCGDNHRDNVLQRLVASSSIRSSEDHNRLVDDKYLLVMKQLRKMGHLKKEDIQRYNLLELLCCKPAFAGKQFRSLVEWDPTALTRTDECGCGPLHFAAQSSSIQGFQLAFDAGIRYYPNKKGINLLFKKDINNRTPFLIACWNPKIRHENIMKAIKDSLSNIYSQQSDDNNNTGGPYNVVDALITAAIDDYVHLDCVYFPLRREPDVLVKLLSTSTTSVISEDSSTNDINSNSNNNNNRNSKKLKSKRKRKRGS